MRSGAGHLLRGKREDRGGAVSRIRQGTFLQFKHRGHGVLAVVLHRAGAEGSPDVVREFQDDLVIIPTLHHGQIGFVRTGALQQEDAILGVVGATALARFGGNQFEKAFDAQKHFCRQLHSRSVCREESRVTSWGY